MDAPAVGEQRDGTNPPAGPRPPINRNGGKKGARQPSKLLRDMRKVLAQDEGQDQGPQQKELRAFLKDDRKAYLTQLTTLEKAHAAGRAKQPAEAKAEQKAESLPPDEGEQRVEALIDRLLGELAEPDACPTCGQHIRPTGGR